MEMKHCRVIVRILASVCLLLAFALQTGCGTPPPRPRNDGGNPFQDRINTTFNPGDKVVIDFADTQGVPSQWPQTVREDGSITLPLNQTVTAAGKQKGQLEQEIHDLYVPKILRRVTVNVRSEQRTFFVTGEVKLPGQKEHTGSMTALRAIGVAGDFTDFADRKDIDIIRASGQKVKMNGKDALKHPERDIPVYPGDTVHVNRRFF